MSGSTRVGRVVSLTPHAPRLNLGSYHPTGPLLDLTLRWTACCWPPFVINESACTTYREPHSGPLDDILSATPEVWQLEHIVVGPI